MVCEKSTILIMLFMLIEAVQNDSMPVDLNNEE